MDDDQDVRRAEVLMLERLGFEVTEAADGLEAVEKYRRALGEGWAFDAVILDMTVPGGMGGKDAVRLILAEDLEAKVMVASGYSEDPVMADPSAHGFCQALQKPFSLTDLRGALSCLDS